MMPEQSCGLITADYKTGCLMHVLSLVRDLPTGRQATRRRSRAVKAGSQIVERTPARAKMKVFAAYY